MKQEKQTILRLFIPTSAWVLMALCLGCSTAAESGRQGFGQGLDEQSKSYPEDSTDPSSSVDTQASESDASSDASQQSSTSNSTSSSPPLCQEGEMRECAQDPEGHAIEFPQGVARGNCKKGYQHCKDGAWSSCKGAVGPKAQDDCAKGGDDATCNGVPNEGCRCIDAQGPRACGQSDQGECKLGKQACEKGVWLACEGEVKPGIERCDGAGLDEDCDGQIDLDDPDCECIHDDVELCVLPGKGDCSLGKRSCNEGRWGECVMRFAPMVREDCASPRQDKHGQALGDEDCDGQVDNNPAQGLDPKGCVPFMVDLDKDGYGAIGNEYHANPRDFTYGCFCANKVPKGPLVRAQAGQINSDCGDCEHQGDRVNPGVTSYHSEPSACLDERQWEGGLFDYNCDRVQEPRFTTVASCEEQNKSCSLKSGHWHQSVPACGQPGRVGGECRTSSPPCETTVPFEMHDQYCR